MVIVEEEEKGGREEEEEEEDGRAFPLSVQPPFYRTNTSCLVGLRADGIGTEGMSRALIDVEFA
jgi:hypothetical protein